MKRSITINLTRLAAYTAAFILAVVSAMSLYWGLQPAGPTSVLEIYNDPLPVQTGQIEAGGQVLALIDFCKKTGNIGTVEVQLIGETGGAKINVNWPVDKLDPICSKDLERRVKCDETKNEATCLVLPIPIPGQTPTDTYHAVFTTRYKVNPLKPSENSFRTDSFKVVNPKL